jgi:hypothetical protein
MKQIISFSKEFSFLSNFDLCDIVYNNKVYKSVEHAYQSSKTLIESEQEMIRNAETPKEAKHLSYKIHKRKDWNEVSLKIMEELLIIKFSIPEYKEALQMTNEYELIEGNYWHDNFYGHCFCDKCKSTEHLNHLGKILMNIRDNV